MARIPEVDVLNSISRCINSGHTITKMCNVLKIDREAMYKRIRRSAFYLVSRLDDVKRLQLKSMLAKKRDINEISLLLDLPPTLIKAADGLLRRDDFPE